MTTQNLSTHFKVRMKYRVIIIFAIDILNFYLQYFSIRYLLQAGQVVLQNEIP